MFSRRCTLTPARERGYSTTESNTLILSHVIVGSFNLAPKGFNPTAVPQGSRGAVNLVMCIFLYCLSSELVFPSEINKARNASHVGSSRREVRDLDEGNGAEEVTVED